MQGEDKARLHKVTGHTRSIKGQNVVTGGTAAHSAMTGRVKVHTCMLKSSTLWVGRKGIHII